LLAWRKKSYKAQKPLTGSPYTPHRETGARGLGSYPWGLFVSKSMNKKLIVLLVWVVIFVAAYYGYYLHQVNSEAEIANSNSKEEKMAIQRKANEDYLKPIIAACDGSITQLSGIDFNRCQQIYKNSFIKVDPSSFEVIGVSDAKSELELYDQGLSAVCKRKIVDMTGNELVECESGFDPAGP
jgi:hypothetical protein